MQDILKTTEDSMKKALSYFEEELKGIQAGRAQVSLIDGLKVNVYGQDMTLLQVGTISTPDPKTLQVQVWDASNVAAVEKAIREAASLGLSPATDGTIVRMQMPLMTEERRQNFVKLLSELQEQVNVSLRNARHDGLKTAKNQKESGELPEDQFFKTEKQLDEMIRKYQGEVETAYSVKKDELLTV